MVPPSSTALIGPLMVDLAQGQRDLMTLVNNHVLVTGGAQGIGEAIVTDCALEGARVSFIDINVEHGEALVAKLTAQGHQV